MATLATIFDRFLAARAAEQVRPCYREDDQPSTLRRFPNEDVYFHIKKIDNTRVVPEADTAAGKTCWRVFGSCVTAVVILIALFLPSLYSLISGYQLEKLRHERQQLEIQQGQLQLEESQLLSPARLEQLANEQQFIDPAPNRYVFLEGKPEGTLARR